MNAHFEQLYMAEILKVNVDYWTNSGHIQAKERLVAKFGSKEKAMEETFLLLWRGFLLAVKNLPEQKSLA